MPISIRRTRNSRRVIVRLLSSKIYIRENPLDRARLISLDPYRSLTASSSTASFNDVLLSSRYTRWNEKIVRPCSKVFWTVIIQRQVRLSNCRYILAALVFIYTAEKIDCGTSVSTLCNFCSICVVCLQCSTFFVVLTPFFLFRRIVASYVQLLSAIFSVYIRSNYS